MRHLGLLVAVVAALLLLPGCATVANPNPRDPLESLNRSVFGFNDGVDRAVVKPVATVYQGVTPSWMRKGVGNFFNNLQDVWSAVNNALQGRGQDTSDSVSRVVINSTMGLGGVIDVASDLNIDRHTANFGLTLGRWGMKPGPYVVLPLLGPSSVRQVAALPIDLNVSMVNLVRDDSTRYGLKALNIVDTRAIYLNAGDVVDGAALDKYSFTRDAYLQRLRNKDYDGNPPEEVDESAQ